MPLPQDITPLNPALMDTLISAGDGDWIPQPFDPERAFIKILWTGSESGAWARAVPVEEGFHGAPTQASLAVTHLHSLGQAPGAGRNLECRRLHLRAQRHAARRPRRHSKTREYLFICNGTVLFYDDEGFTSYLGWEELRRLEESHRQQKEKAA